MEIYNTVGGQLDAGAHGECLECTGRRSQVGGDRLHVPVGAGDSHGPTRLVQHGDGVAHGVAL